MSKRIPFVAGAVFGTALAVSVGAYAALGGSDGVMLPYRGRLESNGVAVDGNYTFHFDVYDAVTAGTQCAGLPDITTQVLGGAFSVVIGPVPEVCVVGKPVWVAASVKLPTDATFTALAGRQRVYPTLAALTSGRGDFNIRGAATINGPVTVNAGVNDAVTAKGTNAAFTLADGTGANMANLALAASTGAYSTDAVANDTVLRANGGKLLLQHGSGASAIAISNSNQVTITGDLTVNGTIRGASAGFGGMFSTVTFEGNPGSACPNGVGLVMAPQINPFTGAASCPGGYNPQLVSRLALCQALIGTQRLDTYYCWK